MLTWNEVVDDFILGVRGTKQPTTALYYERYLAGLTRWATEEAQVSFEAFTARHWRSYVLYRKNATHPLTGKPLAVATLRHDVITARKLFQFAVREGYRKSNPLAEAELPKLTSGLKVKCPTIEEVQALLRAITARWDVRRNPKARYMPANQRAFLRLRDTAIIYTLLETGMRIGEVFALTESDLEFDGPAPSILVRTSKTHTPRRIPVSESYVSLIAPWRSHRAKIALTVNMSRKRAEGLGRPLACQTEAFFCSTVQTPIDYGTFRRTFIGYLDFAGIERFTRHGIRHLFATMQANRNVISAMTLLGHRNLKTTQGYVHEESERIREDSKAASPLRAVVVAAERVKRARVV